MRLGQASAALERDAAAGRLEDVWLWAGWIALELELVSSAIRSVV